MLAIRSPTHCNAKCVPNLLPCRVNHNGPVNASKKHWSPTKAEDGKMISYFRGRKLYGKELNIPDGYTGAMLTATGEELPQNSSNTASDDEEEAEHINVGILEKKAVFDTLVVWGHEVLPDGLSDPFVKGTEEWVAFAAQLHSYETHVAGS